MCFKMYLLFYSALLIMHLSMLAPTSPHTGQGGEFSLFGIADLPQGSGYRIAKVRMRNTNSSRAWSTVQCSAMTCQPSAHRAVSVLEYSV